MPEVVVTFSREHPILTVIGAIYAVWIVFWIPAALFAVLFAPNSDLGLRVRRWLGASGYAFRRMSSQQIRATIENLQRDIRGLEHGLAERFREFSGYAGRGPAVDDPNYRHIALAIQSITRDRDWARFQIDRAREELVRRGEGQPASWSNHEVAP